LRNRVSCSCASCHPALPASGYSSVASNRGARKSLTVERSIRSRAWRAVDARALAWIQMARAHYFETKGSGKEAKTELWEMDAASGERRLLVSSDKLESILPAEPSKPTQATGLGRRAPSLSMGARWAGFVSGPHGTCMAGCEVANGAHVGLR